MGGQFSAYSLVRSFIIFPYDWNNMSKRPANHCFIPKTNPTAKEPKNRPFSNLICHWAAALLSRVISTFLFRRSLGWGGQSPDRNHQRNHSIGLHQSPPTIDSYSFPSWLLPRNGLVQFPFIQDSAPMDLPWKWWWNQVVPSNWNLGHTSLEKETLINSSTYVSSSFHGSKKWVPFKMKVSSAVQICSRGWSQCQGINVWYTSLLGSFKVKCMFICISCICRTARCHKPMLPPWSNGLPIGN